MTLSDCEGHMCCLKPNCHTLGHSIINYDRFIHESESLACKYECCASRYYNSVKYDSEWGGDEDTLVLDTVAFLMTFHTPLSVNRPLHNSQHHLTTH